MPQATKRSHAEMSGSDVAAPSADTTTTTTVNSSSAPTPFENTNGSSSVADPKPSEPAVTECNVNKAPDASTVKTVTAESSANAKQSVNAAADNSKEPAESTQKPAEPAKSVEIPAKTETQIPSQKPEDSSSKQQTPVENSTSAKSEVVEKTAAKVVAPVVPEVLSSKPAQEAASLSEKEAPIKSASEPMEVDTAAGTNTKNSSSEIEIPSKPKSTPTATPVTPAAVNNSSPNSTTPHKAKPALEDGEEPEKKAKLASSSSLTNKGPENSSPEQILKYMDKTFDQRRKIITKQMPTIPELKRLYPDLFMGKQLLIEFQRITKIDIDQKIQEFCVRYATAVIEMASGRKGAAPVLERWRKAQQENDTLKQYWDMVTALCLLPLHFGENFDEMVMEIKEDEEVVAQGKIVPVLVARGNIFRTDEFFLIAENTIVQEFEEFTIAFASLYSSYWVFNMVYPQSIENTYNYIQRCIVKQREAGSIPNVCKNFTKALQKWNKGKDGK